MRQTYNYFILLMACLIIFDLKRIKFKYGPIKLYKLNNKKYEIFKCRFYVYEIYKYYMFQY